MWPDHRFESPLTPARGLHASFRWIRLRYRWRLRREAFLRAPWAGGVVLLLCVAAAMLLANLPLTAEYYEHLWKTELSVIVRSTDGVVDVAFPRGMNVERLINDGLMVIFFFLVGLEIKREIVHGELSTPRKAILPVVGALGGMLAPACVYLLFNHGTAAANGWGIPTATDIAFAVGILSLLGDRVPASLKVFLMALAVADDLGAILVIALFYGGTVKWGLLSVALLIMAGLYTLNRLGETRIGFFLVPAFVVWGLFYYSGIHATLSGVAIAMLVPMRPRYGKSYFFHKMRLLNAALNRTEDDGETFPDVRHRYYLRRMKGLSRDAIGVSDRLETLLQPYVTFLIMPVFALANAGVRIDAEYLDIFSYSPQTGSVGMGVFFGLLLGKPLGIFLASRLAVAFGVAERPAGATWRMLLAVACLGGIGFTMSLFVDALAFDALPLINHGKIAILGGSLSAAVLGVVLVTLFSKTGKSNENA